MRYVGVDGCSAGWVSAGITEDALEPVQVFFNFSDLASATRTSELVLIDIPIGLMEDGPDERDCDRLARRLLGPTRGSSVFRVPVRSAVAAPDYRTASANNYMRTSKRISQQSWGICPKIADVDRHLRQRPDLQHRIRETHPEICFAGLQTWTPVAASKRTDEGMRTRLDILSAYVSNAADILEDALLRFPRSVLAPDDVLDAIATAVTARMAATRGFPSLPGVPRRDEAGLRMEIICPVQPPADFRPAVEVP